MTQAHAATATADNDQGGPVSIIAGMAAIADDYDVFLLDQWGVIHNGYTLHEGAEEAMRRLKQAGKSIVVLSNSGKRAADSFGRLDKLGIPRGHYDAVVTSGEMVHGNLSRRADPFYAALGDKAFIFAWDPDRGVLEGTGVTEVTRIEEAEFILCMGTDRQDLDWYRPYLEAALERGLPMVCGNPDRITVEPDGSLKICPGAVAEIYEGMGGTVRWHGKPTAEVYEASMALAAEAGMSGGRAIGIGDSLIHDIKGASDFGIPSVLIAGGIHGHELKKPLDAADVRELGQRYGAVPRYAAPLFRW